jgi:putative SOS response-associated peptidase YedK
MCGRFTYKPTWEELVRLYRLTLDQPARNTQARYNVCPTDPVDTIVERDGKRELVSMRWGLVPRWWSKSLKDVKMATFNARAETVCSQARQLVEHGRDRDRGLGKSIVTTSCRCPASSRTRSPSRP